MAKQTFTWNTITVLLSPTYSQIYSAKNMGWELPHKQVFPEHLITEGMHDAGKSGNILLSPCPS